MMCRLEEWQTYGIARGWGRPKQTWNRVTESDMSLSGINENMASNKAVWMEIIYVDDST